MVLDSSLERHRATDVLVVLRNHSKEPCLEDLVTEATAIIMICILPAHVDRGRWRSRPCVSKILCVVPQAPIFRIGMDNKKVPRVFAVHDLAISISSRGQQFTTSLLSVAAPLPSSPRVSSFGPKLFFGSLGLGNLFHLDFKACTTSVGPPPLHIYALELAHVNSATSPSRFGLASPPLWSCTNCLWNQGKENNPA